MIEVGLMHESIVFVTIVLDVFATLITTRVP